MASSQSALPPELVREILAWLPRPSLGPPLPAPSPLLATSLVSHAFRTISQELLFECVTVVEEEQALCWMSTHANGHTRELRVVAGWRDEEDDDASMGWLSDTFTRKYSQLKVLEVEVSAEAQLKEGWTSLPGLQGLTALSLTCSLPPKPTPDTLRPLTHLRLITTSPFLHATPASYPSVTHLHLYCAGSVRTNIHTTFPSLTSLTVLRDSPSAFGGLPVRCLDTAGCTRLADFATLDSTELVHAALARGARRLTRAVGQEWNWLGTMSGWFEVPGLMTHLTLLGRTKAEVERMEGGREFVARVAEAECALEFRRSLALPWR